MNDDPSEVSVLYGKIIPLDGAVQQLADSVASYFEKLGMLLVTLFRNRYVSL